jgi:hypothetical protein
MTVSSGADSAKERAAVILTPDQRVRVFISSTLEELAEERAAALRAIRRLHLVSGGYESGPAASAAEHVSGPPFPCITPSTETCVVIVMSFTIDTPRRSAPGPGELDSAYLPTGNSCGPPTPPLLDFFRGRGWYAGCEPSDNRDGFRLSVPTAMDNQPAPSMYGPSASRR